MRGKKFLALAMAAIISATGTTPAFAGGLLDIENTIQMAGEVSGEQTEGDYRYTVSDGQATITSYTGTEEDVVTPGFLGGYPVTEIGEKAFSENGLQSLTVSEGVRRIGYAALWKCRVLKVLNLPASLQVLGLSATTDTTALQKINVSQENPIFFSQSGILFKHVEDGITLYAYPAGREGEEYRVPYFCNSLKAWAFGEIQNLKKLYVPHTIQSIADRILCSGKMPIDVYLNHDKLPYVSAEMFFDMPAGCHVFVKNEQVASDLAAIDIFAKGLSYETPDSSIIVLGTEDHPAIPTTSLTWDGVQTEMDHTLSPGEKCQLTYVQEPFNSTENITWSSSDEKIARVDAVTGLVQASGIVNYTLKAGTCTIIGKSESGHSISVDVAVSVPVEEFQICTKELNKTDYVYYPINVTNISLKCQETYQVYGASIKDGAFNLNDFNVNIPNVQFASSNPNVAVVSTSENDYYYGKKATVTAISPGTTTITATLDDNGTLWSRSFVLAVTKDIAGCTALPIPDQPYTGSPIQPAVTIKDGEKTLVNGTDYTVSYSNNTSAGTAEASIAGKGAYSGASMIYFHITGPVDGGSGNNNNGGGTGNGDGGSAGSIQQPQLKDQPIRGISGSYKKTCGGKPFTLKAKAKGAVTYVSSNRKVASVGKRTGKVSIKGAGICTITVTAAAAEGYRKATKKVTIKVLPKKAALTSAEPLKKGQITLKWKKDASASGYQVQYGTSRKFKEKSTDTETVKSGRTAGRTLRKLKNNKKYYVRVRAYKIATANGKKECLYGSWSTVRQVRTR